MYSGSHLYAFNRSAGTTDLSLANAGSVNLKLANQYGSVLWNDKVYADGQELSDYVFIGEGVNWMCTIINETTEQIDCLTPEKNDESSYDSPVAIHVTVKLREESVTECDDGASCVF